MQKDILAKVEQEISQLETDEQKQLLEDLPHLLKVSLDDLLLLKAAENSFDFWNNPEDSSYDNL